MLGLRNNHNACMTQDVREIIPTGYYACADTKVSAQRVCVCVCVCVTKEEGPGWRGRPVKCNATLCD